jgi:hypothetical protein
MDATSRRIEKLFANFYGDLDAEIGLGVGTDPKLLTPGTGAWRPGEAVHEVLSFNS